MRNELRLIIASLVLALAGCQGIAQAPPDSAGAVEKDPLHDIITRGALRVGVSGDQPPFNMRGRDGELMGLDIDLAEALARAMGLKVEFVPLPFGKLLRTLEAAEVDIVISAMTITPERNVRVPFAGPYYVSGTAVLTKSDELAFVTSIQTLDAGHRRYAAVAGTTNESFILQHLPTATLISTTDFDEAVALVLADQVDAVLADYPMCKYAAMKHADAGFSEQMTPFTVEPLGIAVRTDAPLLVNLVQNYLDTLEYAGLLGQLKARWLGDDDWLELMP